MVGANLGQLDAATRYGCGTQIGSGCNAVGNDPMLAARQPWLRQDEWIYIDALYVIPEYRHHNIGKKAVLNWYDEHKDEEIRLHIVHKNEPAQKFWKGIFELEEIESNFLDTLYRIKSLKRSDAE